MRTRSGILIFAGLALLLGAVWLLLPRQSGLVGIYQDGTLVETVDLQTDRVIALDGAAGGCTARVQDGKIYMETASCPDQVCVKHGALREGGTPIVCLPNRITIDWLETADGGADAVTG